MRCCVKISLCAYVHTTICRYMFVYTHVHIYTLYTFSYFFEGFCVIGRIEVVSPSASLSVCLSVRLHVCIHVCKYVLCMSYVCFSCVYLIYVLCMSSVHVCAMSYVCLVYVLCVSYVCLMCYVLCMSYVCLCYACLYACLCLLYTSPSPRDLSTSRMPSSA